MGEMGARGGLSHRTTNDIQHCKTPIRNTLKNNEGSKGGGNGRGEAGRGKMGERAGSGGGFGGGGDVGGGKAEE